jgi:hypothetical protein
VKIAVGIAHAAFQGKSRRHALENILGTFHAARAEKPFVRVSEKPEHSYAYARGLWRWASYQDADVCLLLNDDITIHPHILKVVKAMVEAVPGEILSLHAQGSDAAAALERGCSWIRSYDLTGPANVMTPAQARELAEFWEDTPDLAGPTGRGVLDINEDNVASQWAYAHQRPMWLALPAPVAHDRSIPSTLGYDHHTLRETSVDWREYRIEMTSVAWWTPKNKYHVPWMQNPWFGVSELEWLRRRRLFPSEAEAACHICERAEAAVRFGNGRGVCRSCVGQIVGTIQQARVQ